MAVTQRYGRRGPINDPLLAEEARKRKTAKNWFLVVLIVFIAAIIFTNLPRSTTLADKQADLRTVATQVKNDLLGCNTAIQDAFDALQAAEQNPAKNAKIAATLLAQDQAECTVVNSDILNLAEANPPAILIQMHVDSVINHYYGWAFPNSDALIAYVTLLVKHPHDAKLITDIRGRFASMTKQLDLANSGMSAIATKLHMTVAPLHLYTIHNIPAGVLA